MWDINIGTGNIYSKTIDSNRSLAILAFEGNGEINANNQDSVYFHEKNFIVLDSDKNSKVTFKAKGQLRLIMIEVPTNVDYPVYNKNF
jgi:redox-sensitive bicupin YhaK (pirin superfamily)